MDDQKNMSSQNNRKEVKKKSLIIIMAIVVALAAVWFVMHLIEKNGETDEQFGDTGEWGSQSDEILSFVFGDDEYESSDNIKAYVLAGTDAGGEDWGEGFNGAMSDFIALLLIDNTTEKYALYQIDRNTMVDVDVPDNGDGFDTYVNEQICTSHWYGDNEEERNNNLVFSVSTLMGELYIEGYYIINMDDIDKLNDAIGGVDVDIETDLTAVDPAFVKGTTVHLTGDLTEKYLRARMTLEDDTNAARMDRHAQYIQNAYETVMDELRSDPDYINDLYAELKDNIETDCSGDISEIAARLLKYENAGILRFDGKTEINDTFNDGIDHEEFYVDTDSIIARMREVMNLTKSEAADGEEDEEDYDEDESLEDMEFEGTTEE